MAAKQGKLALIIGPSGVGKSVILQRLRQKHPEMHFPRSATTRPRRPREGDDLYQFVNDAEFDRLLEEKKLLEWATVHGGARYGTLVDEIIPYIEQGKTVVREVDVQGFNAIRQSPLFSGPLHRFHLQTIFILPESKEQLITHITKRAPIDDDELKRRIESIDTELAFAKDCTAQVINPEGKLADTLKMVEDLLEQD